MVDAADTDVVQATVEAQGDGAGLPDAVGADAVVGVDAGSQGCFGAGLVGGCGGGAVVEGAVWSAVVVFVGEGVELVLQFGGRGGGGLAGQPFLEG